MRRRLFIFAGLVALGGAALLIPRASDVVVPQIVRLPIGTYSYRPAGEFRLGNLIMDVPLEQRYSDGELDIMKYQVTEADYARCQAEFACPNLGSSATSDLAQTGANYDDAAAYAKWFSNQTGQNWRLPTDAEWMRAAGNRAFSDPLPNPSNSADPSLRWLATYRREVTQRGAADAARHPKGSFGENDLGIADMAGNVWEWTDTCQENGILSPDGQAIVASTAYCGVRAVQGKHRAFVITFVRDARSGGCAAGIPPDYLGFRLVRENKAAASLPPL